MRTEAIHTQGVSIGLTLGFVGPQWVVDTTLAQGPDESVGPPGLLSLAVPVRRKISYRGTLPENDQPVTPAQHTVPPAARTPPSAGQCPCPWPLGAVGQERGLGRRLGRAWDCDKTTVLRIARWAAVMTTRSHHTRDMVKYPH